MITLKQLKWSNAFSYGDNNTLCFINSPLTQLVGKNGHGKSSVALILEEVLYNKNSKSIKKGDILNRYVKDKNYQIELEFDKDGVEYRIVTKRGTSQQVQLYKNNVDISGHTSTTTYKVIEDIIGIDHKTFSQIVYQSNASSLEFLTSADTARKKFLIELLNLSKYTKAGEVFKEASVEVGKELAVAQGKVDTIQQWMNKYAKMDFSNKELLDVPAIDLVAIADAERLAVTIQDIEKTNKKITQNNTYKHLKDNLKVLPIPEKPLEIEESYIKAAASASKEYSLAKSFKDRISALHGTCPTCLSEIDEEKVAAIIAEQNALMQGATLRETDANTKAKYIKQQHAAWELAQKSQADWEKYHQLIDEDLPEQVLDENSLKKQLTALQQQLTKTRTQIAEIEKENNSRNLHNSKVALIKGQLEEMTTELNDWDSKLHQLTSKLNTIATLVKTFSTTGLVAYKIENLVKDLESLSNEYLGELSGGRFQISFQISGSDKLNVIITDNGMDISIQALSGGERARVNVATLLAIRKLMQSLSQSRINLLILDETVEALDVDGKEKLIEILLEEEALNTILVSHGFSHPLLEKVHVVKRNNISRIEE